MTCAYNNVNAANAGEIDIADICKDNKINVFDLCVLKQILSKVYLISTQFKSSIFNII